MSRVPLRARSELLLRLAAGWCPTAVQIPHWRKLEKAGVIKLDYGPTDDPVKRDVLCVYLTAKGREEIKS